MSNDNGFFEFNDLEPGPPYHVTISAPGFANWTSPAMILKPGEYLILAGSQLQSQRRRPRIVIYSAEQVATEEVHIAEPQRAFGIIPNFYVVYDQDPEPLTTKLKFRLAMKNLHRHSYHSRRGHVCRYQPGGGRSPTSRAPRLTASALARPLRTASPTL